MVEIKFIFEGAEAAAIPRKFQLPDPDSGKTVAFFDTGDRQLFHGRGRADGVKAILRARFGKKKGKTTVKLRTEGRLPDDLPAHGQSKREDDFAFGRALLDSFSMNADISPAALQTFSDIETIFNDAQKALLKSHFNPELPWEKLTVVGPVTGVTEWEDQDCPDFAPLKLTFELWNLPAFKGRNARQLLEISTRAEVAGWERVAEQMRSQFESMGLSPFASGTKTQIVLDHFAP